jgi:hypothetical protein
MLLLIIQNSHISAAAITIRKFSKALECMQSAPVPEDNVERIEHAKKCMTRKLPSV